MMRLVVQWVLSLLVMWGVLFCTWFTLSSCADDLLMTVLLLPACLCLWSATVVCVIGLVAQTERQLVLHQGDPLTPGGEKT